jgi:hypothetical protein
VERVAFVAGEAGLAATANVLVGSSVHFDVGEAAILAIDEDAWSKAVTREHAWRWVGTLTPSEGR